MSWFPTQRRKNEFVEIILGHKIDPIWGNPIRDIFQIIKHSDGEFVYKGGIWSGSKSSMGESILLKKNSNFVLVTSHPSYEWAGEQYLSVGLSFEQCEIYVAKNPMNYNNIFTGHKYHTYFIDSPGPTPIHIENLHFKKNKSFYPKKMDMQSHTKKFS